MDKGMFKMFAFVAVLIVVGVIATAVMVASNQKANGNGTVAVNGTNGTNGTNGNGT